VFNCAEGTSVHLGRLERRNLHVPEVMVELYVEGFGCSAHEFGLHGQYVRDILLTLCILRIALETSL
jgi:hypothetical protein